MPQRVGPITDTFELTGRGCIVLVPVDEMEKDAVVLIGDAVTIVADGAAPIRTKVVGVELGHRPGNGLLGVLLGPGVRKADIAPGSLLVKDEG